MILRSLFALTLLAAAATVSAQTVINSVPYTISTSGKYVLGNNLVTSLSGQIAITINVSNVILDLNQFFVSGPGNTPSSQQSVISVGNVSNVTIRNGTVANNGFGIFFSGGSNSINHLVEKVNVTRCYLGGIFVGGPATGCLVQENVVTQIGGSTAFSGPASSSAIYTGGGARVEGNAISGLTGAGSGPVTGIFANSGDFMIRNTVSNCNIGILSGKYQNNLTFNCTTPFSGGIDAGLNN